MGLPTVKPKFSVLSVPDIRSQDEGLLGDSALLDPPEGTSHNNKIRQRTSVSWLLHLNHQQVGGRYMLTDDIVESTEETDENLPPSKLAARSEKQGDTRQMVQKIIEGGGTMCVSRDTPDTHLTPRLHVSLDKSSLDVPSRVRHRQRPDVRYMGFGKDHLKNPSLLLPDLNHHHMCP